MVDPYVYEALSLRIFLIKAFRLNDEGVVRST